jgi:nicotinamide-nucleotide amidase
MKKELFLAGLLPEVVQSYLEKNGKSASCEISLTEGGIKLSFLAPEENSNLFVIQEVKAAFHSHVMGQDTISLSLQNAMVEKGKTLALAESCTGGYLSHLITKNRGSSQYFFGSFVTYSNEMKQSILGVPLAILSSFGAVSYETVECMVQGALEKSSADIAIAVTGIAGPDGGSQEKPVGTVWMAIAERGKDLEIGVKIFSGSRFEVIKNVSELALTALYRKIQYKIPAFS